MSQDIRKEESEKEKRKKRALSTHLDCQKHMPVPNTCLSAIVEMWGPAVA
jgi:hypothetical protein